VEATHSSKMLEQIYDPKQNNRQEDNHWNTGRRVIKERALNYILFFSISQHVRDIKYVK
jgi:hypothetical protein